MRNFVIRAIINALAIAVTAWLVPSIQVDTNLVPLFIVGVVLTIINATVKPILTFLTFPITILTLGLFLLVINAGVLGLAAWLTGPSLEVGGFWSALLGGIVLAIVNMIIERVVGVQEKKA